ncbi:MAG: tyrosine-type recombinase/integrase [Mycoplasmatota bacterium]
MIQYNSFMKDMIDKFIKFRIASQQWNDISYGANLKTFENYCISKFPNKTKLTQEMIDTWCNKRITELHKSHNSRIYVIRAFIKYTNSRNLTNLKVPNGSFVPFNSKKNYIPHHFNNEELRNFFNACDMISYTKSSKYNINYKLTIPVFFRLLYSSGIRTTEARQLKCKDVNLEAGVLNIQQSKGYFQHYIVLHNSTKNMMVKYNELISIIFPNREYFFHSINSGMHSKDWVSRNFKKFWNIYNSSYAVPYDLRHNYAITNINKWNNIGLEFNSKLVYLSKSMGHSNIECTKRYYTLTPKIADIFNERVSKTFNELLPEVCDGN